MVFPDEVTSKEKRARHVPEKLGTFSQIHERKRRKLVAIGILEIKEKKRQTKINYGVRNEDVFLPDF
jgi:hypothetical protein